MKWHIDNTHGSNGLVEAEDACSVRMGEYSVAAVWRDCPGAEKNAHLIAAAPELYEACEQALHNSLDLPNFVVDVLEKALAKARGEV